MVQNVLFWRKFVSSVSFKTESSFSESWNTTKLEM